MRFIQHNENTNDKNMSSYHVGYRPRPVFDFMHKFDITMLSSYAGTEFINRMSHVTPAQILQMVGRFPGKEYSEWTSVDVGQCAYMVKYAIQCNSYFANVLDGFIAYYDKLDDLQKQKARDRDRQACLQSHGINARVPNMTWGETAGVIYDLFKSTLDLW